MIYFSFSLQQVILKRYKELGLSTPCVVKVTDNPSSSHLPAKLVNEDLLLHSIVPHRKIICQCVDFVSKDGQLYFSNQRFSIPLGYTGWLEILSEDGKTVSPIKMIEHIADRAPEKFLIRSKTKAFLSTDNGEPDYDRTKIVEKGEVMTIIGRLGITHGWRRQKKQILHCKDANSQDIYFDFKSIGQFSPIAGPTNISGVHSVEGLTNQFRLPLTVRIVSGQIPRVASENERPGVFRLIEIQKDNTALFLPITSHQKLIPVSIRTNLQLIQANNMSNINQNQFYKHLLNLCNKKVGKYFRTMQVLVSAKQLQANTYSAFTLPARRPGHVKHRSHESQSMKTEEDVLFAEVDDLYAYVRRGGVPPKPRPRSWATMTEDTNILMLADGKSNSQPMLAAAKPRGLLATLTAGKFPSRSTVVRQYKVSKSPTTPDQAPTRMFAMDTSELPVTRASDKIRSYIDKYQGSMESLQTEVDPYVDEAQCKNSSESIDISCSKAVSQTRHLSLGRARPRTFSTPLVVVSPVTKTSPVSPSESKSYKGVSQFVLPKPRSHTYRQSDSQPRAITFLESTAKYIHQSVQAT